MSLRVLLYWPNVVGYIRIVLVFAAWAAYHKPTLFICLYSVYIALDGLDGWLARRLNQTSRFGAWLDVVVDNLGRGMLWSSLCEWGWLVSALEWCVFVCNHSGRGERWKESFSRSPALVQAVMANGFRTPLGLWAVSGLHCLPLWLYGCHSGVLAHWVGLAHWAGLAHWVGPAHWVAPLGTMILASGRLLALPVELWCVWTHIEHLNTAELEEKKSRKETKDFTPCLPAGPVHPEAKKSR